MNIAIVGGAGFLGKNLAQMLYQQQNNKITVVDANVSFWKYMSVPECENIQFCSQAFGSDSDYKVLLKEKDIVYHLASTSFPAISNLNIKKEIEENILGTIRLLEDCITCGVKKVVFFSSGGTVYGKNGQCPLAENAATDPITAYGVQKLTIEKLLSLYRRIYGLQFKVVRLANPFGPYQRPNGKLGVITTFIYRALNGEEITVYGDGSVVRDYIYVDDAIRAVIRIANDENSAQDIYNVGSGYGTSVQELLTLIQNTLQIQLRVSYQQARAIDVPINYLDVSRYEDEYGPLIQVGLAEGIQKTALYLQRNGISSNLC